MNPARDGLSIGRLAESTGIAVDTIRKWEQRYGYPLARRLPSGHRRYDEEDVRRLRRIAEAISRGIPVRKAVSAPEHQLEELLASAQTSERPAEINPDWLAFIRGYKTREFARALEQSFEQLGVERFLEERMGPWLTEVGAMWARGEIDVRHEHFASEVSVDVLRSLLARHQVHPAGPRIVFTTLPGEKHAIGLWMSALAAAASGADVRILGPDLPLDEIAGAVRELNARAVAISVSLSTGGVATDRQLAELRDAIDDGVHLAVGGDGARGTRRGPRGVHYFDSYPRYCEWVRELSQFPRRGDA